MYGVSYPAVDVQEGRVMEALHILGESWPLACVAMTGIVVGGACWIVRRGTYNHQAYLQVRDERDRLLRASDVHMGR